MAEIRITDLAMGDILSIAEFIGHDSERYAAVQVEKIWQAISGINKFPLRGRIVPEFKNKSIREIIAGNYRIIYHIKPDKNIDVLTVHHGAKLLQGLFIRSKD